jgi:hypothetical protein
MMSHDRVIDSIPQAANQQHQAGGLGGFPGNASVQPGIVGQVKHQCAGDQARRDHLRQPHDGNAEHGFEIFRVLLLLVCLFWLVLFVCPAGDKTRPGRCIHVDAP